MRRIAGGVVKKPFYTWEGDTPVLNILGTPNAKRDAIGKVEGHRLCVSVLYGQQNPHPVRTRGRAISRTRIRVQDTFSASTAA
jgi:hypothetical protein